MKEKYLIVYQGGEGEIVEKKSRFIATIFPIQNEEEANEILERTRKKYWDATHNCFAYVLGENQEIQRCSDDGEPSGTAGRPMLEVLIGEDIHNVLVIVTRYFGGTLLGTGGLVRAYAKAVKEGLEHSTIVEKCLGKKYCIDTDYNGIGKLQYITAQMNLTTIDTLYTDKVQLYLLVPVSDAETFEKKVVEATAGKAGIEVLDKVYYGTANKEVILF